MSVINESPNSQTPSPRSPYLLNPPTSYPIPMPPTPEILALLLDVSSRQPADSFAAARDVVQNLAQRRLFTGQLTANGDKVAVVALASDATHNDMARASADGRYKHVDIVSPASKLSFDVVHRIRGIAQASGAQKAHYSEGLDVAAEHVMTRGQGRKRIVLVTDGKGRIQGDRRRSARDLVAFAETAGSVGISCQVILVDGIEDGDWEGEEGGEEEDDEEEDDGEEENDEDDYFSDLDEEGDDGLSEGQLRTRRLFSGWRLDRDFERRKRAHRRANERRGVDMPSDATMQRRTLLAALSKVLGNEAWGIKRAQKWLAHPVFKAKKAVTKYRNVFDIANIVQIPVKVFTRARVAGKPQASRLSWATTVHHNRRYGTTDQKAWRLETDLLGPVIEDEEIAEAFPYGKGLFEIDDDLAHAYNHSIAMEPCLSMISFLPRSEVPFKLFAEGVDVMMPMSVPGNDGPQRALRALAKELMAKKCGILARYIFRRNNTGKVNLVFLWPEEYRCRRGKGEGGLWKDVNDSDDESDDDDAESMADGEGQSRPHKTYYYFNMVKVPTLHDAVEYPFESLAPKKAEIADADQSIMDKFVAARDLDEDLEGEASGGVTFSEADVAATEGRAQVRSQEDNEDEESGAFDPVNYCNPTLDRFYTSLVTRALEGGAGTSGIADPAPWAKALIDPSNALRPRNARRARSTAADVKSCFPLTKSEASGARNRKTKQHHIAAASGTAMDTTHLKSFETEKEDRRPTSGDEEDGHRRGESLDKFMSALAVAGEDDGAKVSAVEFGEAPSNGVLTAEADEEDQVDSGDDGAMSVVTQVPCLIGEDDPVSDFKIMIRKGMVGRALDGMKIVILSCIRGADPVKAAECLAAMRRGAIKKAALNEFNAVLDTIVSRTRMDNIQGNAARNFLAHMKRDPKRLASLAVIMPKNVAGADGAGGNVEANMNPPVSRLKELMAAIEGFGVDAGNGKGGDGTSAVTQH